ncbi:PREDICTED: VWFA and cache domain-containing protein 1 [Nicrophorus vespilloides]|uniref:VWFA and cache domain-containing protein 1 n=1 Tax=Nicrophorus vespilloides TaxID=110193 RepID=A0ABM1M542_NICVS|nr:PREDICTED: VWFA and cache domain-containing protein 1 [Nicrophorus vespilloides]
MMHCVTDQKLTIFLFICAFSMSFGKFHINVTSKSKVQIVESIQGYYLQNISVQLSEDIQKTSNEEMGIAFMQQMYKKFKYTSSLQDVEKRLARISNQIESRINETHSILNETRKFIEYYYTITNISSFTSSIIPCNERDYILDEFEISNTIINPTNIYIEQPFNIKQVLKKQKVQNKKLKDAIKQKYFLSNMDVLNHHNADISNCNYHNHSLLWSTYMSRIKHKHKNILLLLDHGGSLSKQQFKIVNSIAKQVISVLNDNDNIGLLALSDVYKLPYLLDNCSVHHYKGETYYISSASKNNKQYLYRFINSLTKGTGATNHSLGLKEALQIIKYSKIPSNESIMILYVSRGLLSSLTESKTVLETISKNLEGIKNPIIINTCAVIDESKPIMYETHFLRDVAEQNYSKYKIDNDYNVNRGIMLMVNSTQGVGLAVARFFNTLEDETTMYDLDFQISLPIWDSFSKELILSATVPCGASGEFGVLGMDLLLANLVEDITYYSNYNDYTYAFLINIAGIAIMHPSYARPMSVQGQPNYVDISYLEKADNFNEVRPMLLNQTRGQFQISDKNDTLLYHWRRVSNIYVICIVVKENVMPPKRPYKVNWFPTTNQLVHHRLDIIPTSTLCRHFNQLATMDAGTLYLSASCFQSPTTYIYSSTSSSFSPLTVQKSMAFLKDNTRYLSNPGLREEIRDDVATLAHFLEYLRTQHLEGLKRKYIVRRYVTSPTGVLEMFPGGIISPEFEPTKRTWFLQAVENRFKTILTPPYLDAGGAGYIVTIAYATEHAIVAMDLTFGYIYKLIIDNMPFCKEKQLKCFMMNNHGYLIYHPNLIDPNGHGPIEQQHIIHKESLVANDILNHVHFVKKVLCNNYADGTIQRYYILNTSLDHVLVNAVHGEHSAKYQVAAVEGTNVFIGVVNATNGVVATFCPCNMISRLCLNCNRMEQKECECPCECPLNLDTCTYPNKTLPDNQLCPTVPEQTFSVPREVFLNIEDELKPCIKITCEELSTYEACLGILGCEWCQIDVDGETILANPFCTSIQTCFNGILGSLTPYGDSTERVLDSEDLMGSGYSPIGPVIGTGLAVCLILIFSFICYRSYTAPTVERFYLTSTQENHVRMSDLHISDDYHELDNHQDKLLQDNKKIEPLSPYCVSTGYCRPVTAADSDHGYSTMTPHDESEHLSFAPLEIDSLEDDCTSDAASINTSVSSKQRPTRLLDKNKKNLSTDLQITSLPRNCIIAPVTVHRNMEFTN